MRSNKSQLSIFIIVALLLIILFLFLITISTNEKKEDLVIEKTKISFEKNDKLFPLKDNVDFCLERELKKALIISGLRGGFIYDKEEFYSPGLINEHFYDYDFLSKLNLNLNYLTDKVLIHGQYDVYSPYPPEEKLVLISESTEIPIYSHSIKDDFDKYILDEFIKCIELEEYSKAGYNISYENHISKINKKIDNKNFILNDEIGKINDKVKLTIAEKEFIGKIIKNDNSKSFVRFSEEIFSENDLFELYVTNINTKISIDTIFNDENVIAKLEFPIKIFNKDFETSYKQSQVIANVRLKKLLDISKSLLESKFLDRSLDYSNETNLNSILFKDGSYLSKTDLTNIKVYKTYTNYSNEHVQIVYSIVDADSKIFGRPYIFNFGYDNTAPYLNKNKIIQSGIGGELFFLIAPEYLFTEDLRQYINNNEFIDNYYFYFEPQISKEFNLTKTGTVSFTTPYRGTYYYPITITDGETTREEEIIFSTGVPTNKNNMDAILCFNFKNIEKKSFPIDLKYNDKLHSFIENGIHQVFGYKLISTPSLDNSILEIKKSCLLYNNNYYAEYEVKFGNSLITSGTLNINDTNISIPSTNAPLDITIKIFNNRGQQLGDDYLITIYTAKCLGPQPYPTNQQDLIGGIGTCCDTSVLETSDYPDRADVSNNIFGDNKIVVNSPMYFTLNIKDLNLRNTIAWETPSLNTQASSLFESNVYATCKGSKPSWEDNFNSIQIPSASHTPSANILNNNLVVKSNVGVQLKLISSAPICEFRSLYSKTNLQLGIDGIKLISGFKSLNENQVTSGPIPLSSVYSNTFVKCNNNVYGSSNGFNWVLNSFGKDSYEPILYSSNGYCQMGEVSCIGGRINSPGSNYDVAKQCEDIYFNGNSIISDGAENTFCPIGEICNPSSFSCETP